MKNDRTWERFYSIPQKLFSFHASRPVLLLRGLVLFVIGILGVMNPVLVLTTVTMILGGVVLLFAVAAFLMTWNKGRVSAALLLLFVLLGIAGLGMLIYPLYLDMFLMIVCGVWLIFVGVWSILAAQKRFGQLLLPMPGLVAALIGLLLACPLSPVGPQILALANKTAFMGPGAALGAYSGIAIGKDFKEFAKAGWKYVIVTIFVIAGTFFFSALVAQFVLKMTGAI